MLTLVINIRPGAGLAWPFLLRLTESFSPSSPVQEKEGEAPSSQPSSKKGREGKLGAQDPDVGPGANFP